MSDEDNPVAGASLNKAFIQRLVAYTQAKLPHVITDEDWNRWRAIAYQELLNGQNPGQGEAVPCEYGTSPDDAEDGEEIK